MPVTPVTSGSFTQHHEAIETDAMCGSLILSTKYVSKQFMRLMRANGCAHYQLQFDTGETVVSYSIVGLHLGTTLHISVTAVHRPRLKVIKPWTIMQPRSLASTCHPK